MATIDQQFLQAVQSMFAQMATAHQSNTEPVGEFIKNMPKAGKVDSGGLWRGLQVNQTAHLHAHPQARSRYIPQIGQSQR